MMFKVCITEQWDYKCVIFLKTITNRNQITQTDFCSKCFAVMEKTENGSYLLHISKRYSEHDLCLFVVYGNQCKEHVTTVKTDLRESSSECPFNHIVRDNCTITQLNTTCAGSTYNEDYRNASYATDFQAQCGNNDSCVINVTRPTINCNCSTYNRTVKKPVQITVGELTTGEGQTIDPVQAVEIMEKMANIASQLNESSAELSAGEGATGILVKQEEKPEDMEDVAFAYLSSDSTVNMITNSDVLTQFSRSITVSKEAFQKASQFTKSAPFLAVLRFNNLAKDEKNSSVLGNEVVALEMGAMIRNLTKNIAITFRNVKELKEQNASCQSWNGQGNLPIWTDDGCLTIVDGDIITCQCSHLTFFAVLMSGPNITISASDLSNLTIITSVGCGLSMFFLSIILFMHFLLRRAKANMATTILIHLVSAMFLLNLTFLTNSWVANLKNLIGCKIMAALMHYFMLATFTWFAVEAFHLCLQLYMAGKVTIRHYILKVSITSWVLPSLAVIVLLSTEKYGEQVIQTEGNNVTMCWIIDTDVHYIVNIGYYALVFLFTFTTFIVILRWLFFLPKAGTGQVSQNGKSIVTILGLCCMLGITWGFAFFAYGVLRVPSYYIFTIFNSFQGFFLFIYYYYNTSHTRGTEDAGRNENSTSTSSSNTMKTTVEHTNPYIDLLVRK